MLYYLGSALQTHRSRCEDTQLICTSFSHNLNRFSHDADQLKVHQSIISACFVHIGTCLETNFKMEIFFYKIKNVKPYHEWLFRANNACKLAIFDIRWTKDICATRNLSESQLSHRAPSGFTARNVFGLFIDTNCIGAIVFH